METLRITRREYDNLIVMYPDWMREHWPKLAVHWKLGGPMIIATSEQCRELRKRISLLTALQTMGAL